MAFTQNGQTIPEPYVRNGGNLSPPLRWKNAPAGTRNFLPVVEDPDARHVSPLGRL
jgi:phosphatidylethanolamine-binding protein (PEBP) family uncharacterized protein